MSTPIIVLIAITLFLSFILPFALRRIYYQKLFLNLEQKKIDELNLLLDSILCKLLFRPFNREFLRLNGYLINDDSKHIDQQFHLLINEMQLNQKQSLSVLNKAFNYYLSKKDRKHTREVLDELKKNQISKNELKNKEMLYDIIVEKKATYVNEILKMIEEQLKSSANLSNGAIKYRISVLQYLLGVQYSYLHDTKNMDRYFNLALEKLKGTAFEKEIQSIISEI